MDALISASGADQQVNSKTSALYTWLLGYELTDTVMALWEDAIYFLSNKNEIDFLKSLEAIEEKKGIPRVKFLVRDKVQIFIDFAFPRETVMHNIMYTFF